MADPLLSIAAVFPVPYNLLLQRGVTWTRVLAWFDTATGIATTALVGATARLQMRALDDESSPALVTLTSSGAGIVIDGAAGTLTITLSAALLAPTPALPAQGFYDLYVYQSSGAPLCLIKGAFYVQTRNTTP